jgi:8-oxo-dGTP pyrophosphatase MutT (NUDIX family)
MKTEPMMSAITCTDFYGKAHVVDSSQLIDRLSAYGVFIVDGAVLLIQDPRSQRWELPGGGVEKAETIRQGLAREFQEETGATPRGKFDLLTEWEEYFFDVTSQQAWRSKRKFYIVKKIDHENNLLVGGNGDDSATAKLVPINELAALPISPAIKDVVGLAGRYMLP